MANKEAALIVKRKDDVYQRCQLLDFESWASFGILHYEVSQSRSFSLNLEGDENAPVVLIDTPGFDNNNEILPGQSRLAGIIYLERVSHPRKVPKLGEEFKKTTRKIRGFCEDQSTAKVVIATTFWDKVSGLVREKELEAHFLRPSLMESIVKMMRQNRGRETALEIVSMILKKEEQARRNQMDQLAVRVDQPASSRKTSAAQEFIRIIKGLLRTF
ncbi:hypothetical protein CPB83DRAFT_833669 [Crepidotus variabilis]|uniref:G domain-containing protein n=1 Tax=Crepidotus variabilis TaxID=179855 RepID=A0A9P6ELE2_9AGAR|nr:hypothetical protein CPB83DRAFT_833669 [Crepidotus variabilis]